MKYGKVYLYNPTISDLTVKVNDSTLSDQGAHFIAGTTQETNWVPRLAAKTIDRGETKAKNVLGFEENELYIYPNIEKGMLSASEATGIKAKVKVRFDLAQGPLDLMLFLFLNDSGKYGHLLINSLGKTVESKERT